ncbi:MAG: hypothetical protein AB8E82_06605 [Aureispira sp.]
MKNLNGRPTVIFDPKTTGLNDQEFRALTEEMRGTGDTYYTANQLYSSYLGTGKVSCMTRFFLFILVVVTTVFMININYVKNTYLGNSMYIDVALIGVFAAAMTGLFTLKDKIKISYEEFDQLLQRWLKHQPMPNLLIKPSLQEAPSNPFGEQDLYDYGVESILVVDKDIYVDLFVKNNYQAEWKAVVISQNAYPHYLITQVQKILDDNPSIKLQYLHDSTSNQFDMRAKLDGFLRIPTSVEEVDLGLNEDDSNKTDILKTRSAENKGLQLDHLPPARLAQTMGVAVVGGILIGEVLRSYNSNSGGSSDFG